MVYHILRCIIIPLPLLMRGVNPTSQFLQKPASSADILEEYLPSHPWRRTLPRRPVQRAFPRFFMNTLNRWLEYANSLGIGNVWDCNHLKIHPARIYLTKLLDIEVEADGQIHDGFIELTWQGGAPWVFYLQNKINLWQMLPDWYKPILPYPPTINRIREGKHRFMGTNV